jgi:hypothetical protein
MMVTTENGNHSGARLALYLYSLMSYNNNKPRWNETMTPAMTMEEDNNNNNNNSERQQ